MTDRKVQDVQYPGEEGFWRTSPELIDMQPDLKKLWSNLDEIPALDEAGIKSLQSGDQIAVKKVDKNVYDVFELGSEVGMNPARLYNKYVVIPKESEPNDADPPIKVSLHKWSSGIQISASPVTDDFDNSLIIEKGNDQIKKLPTDVNNEATRQAGLKELNKWKRLKTLEENGGPEWDEHLRRQDENKRIFDGLINSVGK